MLSTPVHGQHPSRVLYNDHMEPSALHLYAHDHPEWIQQDVSTSPKPHPEMESVYQGNGGTRFAPSHTDVLSDTPAPQRQDNSDITLVNSLDLPDFSLQGDVLPTEITPHLPDFSIPTPPPPNLQVLVEPLSELVQILGRLAFSRHETAHLRTEIAFLQKASQYKSAHLLDSKQQSLLASQQPGLQLDATESERLSQQFLDDHAEFERTMDSIRGYEEDLNHRECDMKNREDQLNTVARALIDSIRAIGVLSPEELLRLETQEPGTQPMSPRPLTPKYPDALEDYFDKAGDILVMQERLEHLQVDYRDDVLRRQLREDQELPLEIPQELFEAEYRDSLEKAATAVDNARLAAKLAYEACLNQGIDPGDHMQHITQPEPPESDVASSLSAQLVGREARSRSLTAQSSTSELQQANGPAVHGQDESKGKTKKPRRRRKRNSTRVRRWMDVDGGNGVFTAEQFQSQIDALGNAGPRLSTIRRWRSLTGLREASFQTSPSIGSPNLALSTDQAQVQNEAESNQTEGRTSQGRARSGSV